MTVEELISLNQMITDAVITVRKNGTALLDQLNIGCERGIEPRYPTMVPKEERYIGTLNIKNKKKAILVVILIAIIAIWPLKGLASLVTLYIFSGVVNLAIFTYRRKKGDK